LIYFSIKNTLKKKFIPSKFTKLYNKKKPSRGELTIHIKKKKKKEEDGPSN
jgi:hypothetical protein